jgi:hypothetical protein
VNVFSVALVAVVGVLALALGTDHPVTFFVAVAGLVVLLKLAWERRRPKVELHPATPGSDRIDPYRAPE